MKNIIKTLILFLIGGFSYVCVELLYRGYSHWSMFILGGLCFYLIGLLNEHISWNLELPYQGLIGAGIITALEFFTGVFVNIIFKWNVWDYSNLPFNVLGQICLPFTFIWFFIALLAIFLDDFLRWKLFKEEKPHYHL